MDQVQHAHRYSEQEGARLRHQARTLTELLHHDTFYPKGSLVLEVGCGVGAQTVILAKTSPQARFFSIDSSDESLASARAFAYEEGVRNVQFERLDIYNPDFEDETFDHIFLCFMLEHCIRPIDVLVNLRRVLKPGGTITAIEGDHGSIYFCPESAAARKTIQCLIDIQAGLGGNAQMGRQIYPVLKAAGYKNIKVSPRMVYVDSSVPHLVEGFTKGTFIAMVEGAKEQALRFGMIDEKSWAKGIADLYRTTEKDGTFCYTFFKGVALKR